MKISVWVIGLLFILMACQKAADQTQTVRFLPIQFLDGYGPFHPGFSPIENASKDSPVWAKTYQPVKGLPPHWRKTQVCRVWLNTHQFVYQNFLAGNISLIHYQGLQKGWQWTPDTTKLSKTPIKCYIYLIKGFDEKTGQWSVLVDTNNNLDFSDEVAVYPERMNSKDPYPYKQPILIQYEVYQQGQVRQTKLPMVLKMYGSELLYNFPQHALATFRHGDKQHRLLISSSFTRPDFEVTNLVDPSRMVFAKKVAPNDEIEINDIFELDGVRYQNKGVDLFNNWLELDPVSSSRTSSSLQVGYAFEPFVAKAFDSEQVIDLREYRGRYVYVDFWATWCKGCVADLPKLKKVYQEVRPKRVVFIGVVQDTPQRLATFLTKQPLAWPQVVSDSTNQLIEQYHVTSLPTSVLIDPSGQVIGRNLRPEELALVLRKVY